MIEKQCISCNEMKDEKEFRKQSAAKDGLKPYCKKCDSAKASERYKKKRDYMIQNILEWQDKNPEKMKQYRKNQKRKAREENKHIIVAENVEISTETPTVTT